jgi:site-specific DNA-methyltransferase (adenine-specific)
MLLDNNNIYNIDCLDGMKMLGDETIDLVVTDPPYRIISGGCRINEHSDDPGGILNRRKKSNKDMSVENIRQGKMFKEADISFSDWVPEIYRVLKKGTHFYVMVNDRNLREMMNVCVGAGFKEVNLLAWKKNNCTPNKFYMKNMEYILMFRKGRARNINNMGSKQCIEVPNIIGKKTHPTEKPIELSEILINNSSNVGEVVFDPFMGTGSVAIAAKKNDRKYLGFELDQDYYNIAIERLGV